MHLLGGGPECASIVFLACQDQKKPWTFWYAYMSWPRAQIWFRHKRGKLVTASLLLDCIDWYSCLRYWNEFFCSCVSGYRLKFSRIVFWRKRLQLDSKSDVTTNGLILGFSVGKWLNSLTSYLYGLKFARHAQ